MTRNKSSLFLIWIARNTGFSFFHVSYLFLSDQLCLLQGILTWMGNLKINVIFSLFCSMVVLKPLLGCRSATYIFPCPLTLYWIYHSLFLVMPFISAIFDIQLKMGGMFVCQEQLHSFYFYSFNNFSFWVFALYEYCLEKDLWQGLQPCACQYLPKIFIHFSLSCSMY